MTLLSAAIVLGAAPFFAPTLDPRLATAAEVGFAALAIFFVLWAALGSVLPSRDRPLASRAPNLIGYLLALLVLVIALERATTWIT